MPASARRERSDTRSSRPRWETGEGLLWLGTVLLYRFEKPAPAIGPFLDAFEAAGWATDRLPIPLKREPNESDHEFQVRAETTIKNLNRRLRDTPLHFRLTHDRKGVRWELLPKKGKRR